MLGPMVIFVQHTHRICSDLGLLIVARFAKGKSDRAVQRQQHREPDIVAMEFWRRRNEFCAEPEPHVFGCRDRHGQPDSDERGWFRDSGHLRVTVGATEVSVEYVRAVVPADETATRRNGSIVTSYVMR